MPAQTPTGFSVIDTYNFIREDMQASSDYEEELLDLDQQQAVPQFSFSTSTTSSSPSFPTLTTAAGSGIIQQANNLYSSSSSCSSSSPSPSPSPPYSSSSSSPAPVSPHCPLPPPQSVEEQQQQMPSFADMDLMGTSFLEELMMGDDDPIHSLGLTPLQPVPTFSQPQLSSSSSSSTTTTTTTFVAGAASSGCTVVQRGGGEGRDQQLLLHTDITELCDLDKHQSFYDDRVFKDDGKDWVHAQLGLREEAGHPAQGAQPRKPPQGTGPSLTELGPMARSEQEDIINIFVGIRREILQECKPLGISPDPKEWSARDSQAWTVYMLDKYQKVDDCSASVAMPGSLLCQKTEQEMLWMSPLSGDFLHQQLHMWLALATAEFPAPKPEPQSLVAVQPSPLSSATPSYLPPSVSPAPSLDSLCSPQSSSSSSLSSSDAEMLWKQDNSEEEFFRDSIANLSPPELPKSTKPSSKQHSGRPGKQIRLWEFLKELLEDNDSSMKWLDRMRGIFKIEDSTRVSRLWGIRKNHPEMNYDKLSRSIRQYYKKGIIKKTTQTRRLVYQFCERYL